MLRLTALLSLWVGFTPFFAYAQEEQVPHTPPLTTNQAPAQITEESIHETQQVEEELEEEEPPPPTPARGSSVRRTNPGKKAQGSRARGRFEAETVLKSRYRHKGRQLDVDPD